MKFRAGWCACAFTFAGLIFFGAPVLQAQQVEHVVSSEALRQDVQKSAEVREANETAVRQLLATDAAQRAMQSSHIEYKRVDEAVSQLSDEDLARLADRSREIQNDFAAGNISDRDLLIIVLCIAALVLIIVAVR